MAAIIIQMCLGAVYAWSVFLNPLTAEFGWSKTEVSVTFTIFLVIYSVGMIFGGRWQDSAGPSRVTAVGGTLLGLGYLLASGVDTLWGLYLSYGLLGGMGVGIAYSCPIFTSLKWFPDKRGVATGFAVAGFGAGALLAAPLATKIILAWGWRQAFLTLGIAFFFLVLAGSRFLVNPPHGWTPAGWTPPQTDQKQNTRDFERREVLSTHQFWLLWIMFSFGTSAGLMVIGHLAAFMRETGLSAQTAALAVGVLAILNGTGRIAWGLISDRIGRLQSLKVTFLVIGLTMLAFPHLNSAAAFLLAAAAVGLGFGGFLALFPALTADYFGTKNVGGNYGLLFTAYGVGGLVGPSLGARIYDIFGSYFTAFIVMACLCFVALGVSIFVKPPLRDGKAA